MINCFDTDTWEKSICGKYVYIHIGKYVVWRFRSEKYDKICYEVIDISIEDRFFSSNSKAIFTMYIEYDMDSVHYRNAAIYCVTYAYMMQNYKINSKSIKQLKKMIESDGSFIARYGEVANIFKRFANAFNLLNY